MAIVQHCLNRQERSERKKVCQRHTFSEEWRKPVPQGVSLGVAKPTKRKKQNVSLRFVESLMVHQIEKNDVFFTSFFSISDIRLSAGDICFASEIASR